MKMAFVLLTILVTYSHPLLADGNILVSKLNEIPVEEIELDYSLISNLERSQKESSTNFKKDFALLNKAKFKMINGDLKMAEFYLNQLNDMTSTLTPVKYRYLSLIKFIQGDYQNSLRLIDQKFIQENTVTYQQTCLLKIIDMMALNLTKELSSEGMKCMTVTDKFSKNDQYWLDTMIKLKTKDFAGVHKNLLTDVEHTLNDDEMSKLWVKTGLFLNKESDILAVLSLLPESSYQSKRIREIVALMYLRVGEKEKALQFIDDIESANAENIKGSINLQNKQYELAFGHFKLALKKKGDSANALERAVPLAWLLNQFDDGISMINKIPNKDLDERKKDALAIAFLIRLKKYDQARLQIQYLKNKFQNISPLEVNLMDTYIQMINQDGKNKLDKRKLEDTTEKSCKEFDGISCWLSLSQIHWENLGKTVKRDEQVISDKIESIDSLKVKKEIIPLSEPLSVDQKDIEELDSDGVQIPMN